MHGCRAFLIFLKKEKNRKKTFLAVERAQIVVLHMKRRSERRIAKVYSTAP